MSFPERDQPSRQLGHPSTWPAAPPMPQQTRPRKSRAPLVVLAVAVALALMAGAGAGVWWLTKPTGGATAGSAVSPSATPTAPSPTPEATLAQIDERATCNALVPLLDRTVNLVLAYAKGQPWNRADAERLHGELMTLYKVAPPSMKEDIGSQATTVSAIVNGGGYDRDYVVNSGTRLAESCRKYARS